jgi:hypothetical protein
MANASGAAIPHGSLLHVTSKPSPAPASQRVQLKTDHRAGSGVLCPECEEEQAKRIQRKSASGAADGDSPNPEVNPVPPGGGMPLDDASRAYFGMRFGHDFSEVRIHRGAEASSLAGAFNALAYTTGRDIVFGEGNYAPHTLPGQRLLAHELVHTIQQQHGRVAPPRDYSSAADSDEREAEQVADIVADSPWGNRGQPLVRGPEHAIRQGAVESASIQRACGPAQIPARLVSCPIVKGAAAVGTRFFFKTDCDDFADGQEAALNKFLATIPSSSTVNVLGLASGGAPAFKENLSCSRAAKAATILLAKGVSVGSVQGTGGIGAAGDSTSEAVDLQTQTAAPAPSAPPAPGPAAPAPAAGPVTVTFPTVNAASTPAGGANRIPPRVDTPITVQVNGTPAATAPIMLSVMNSGGKNGTALIDGGAATSITATKTIKLRGAAQTAKGTGSNLALIAKQSNNTIGQSNVFSVAAIPQNLAFTFQELLTGAERGFRAFGQWVSDSGTIADLDQAIVQEHIEAETKTGGFAGIAITTSGPIPANGAEVDKHSVPTSACSQVGQLKLKQTHTYNDTRSQSTDVPITNSGFIILHEVKNKDPAFGGGREITTSKDGQATIANGFQSGAGSGSIIQPQDV